MRTNTFRILAVEDDVDDRMLLDEAFMAIHYEAEIKKMQDGDSLFDYLNKVEPALYPSLIILDNTLPKTSSLELLQQLKGNDAFAAIPVVIYTTLVSPEVKQKLLAAGALDCLQKKLAMREMVEDAKWFRDIAEAQAWGREPPAITG